jgi:hypothetical protein
VATAHHHRIVVGSELRLTHCPSPRSSLITKARISLSLSELTRRGPDNVPTSGIGATE